MNKLGVAPYYTEYESEYKHKVNLKFYKTLGEYEADRLEARMLILEDKPIPQDLYDRLLYTKQELASNK